MLQTHIGQMLLLAASIFSYFPIITLSSTTDNADIEDKCLGTAGNVINEFDDERKKNIWYSQGNCRYFKQCDPPSLTARCSQLKNESSLDFHMFTRMSNVTSLTLETMELKMVSGIFAPLRKLVRLEMYRIHNLDIVEHTFNGTNNLLELWILSSDLTSLPNIHIPGLKHLNLQQIIKGNIEKDDFIGLPALERLEVLYSDIRTIHEDAFLPLTQLKYLDLSGNKIASLTQNHLRSNFQLEVLFMSYVENLTQLPRFELNGMNNENYTIREFHSRDCGLEFITDGAFNAMPALKILILCGNRLKTLPHGLFKSLSSLQSLDLSRNAISNISDDMFEGAIKLSELGFRDNPITSLRMTPFLHTPELSSLDLTGCQINTWSATSPPLMSIRSLSLHGNKLNHITVEQLKTVPQLTRLEVRYNPLKCDNTFHDSVKWLLSHRVKTSADLKDGISFCNGSLNNRDCWCFLVEYYCYASEMLEQEGIGVIDRVQNDISNFFRTDYIGRINYIIHHSYKKIASSIIPLIGLIITIFLVTAIVKFRPYKKIAGESKVVSPGVSSVYERLAEDFTPSVISTKQNIFTNDIAETFHVAKSLPEKN